MEESNPVVKELEKNRHKIAVEMGENEVPVGYTIRFDDSNARTQLNTSTGTLSLDMDINSRKMNCGILPLFAPELLISFGSLRDGRSLWQGNLKSACSSTPGLLFLRTSWRILNLIIRQTSAPQPFQ